MEPTVEKIEKNNPDNIVSLSKDIFHANYKGYDERPPLHSVLVWYSSNYFLFSTVKSF